MKEYIVKRMPAPLSSADSAWSTVPSVTLDYVWQDDCPSPYVTKAQLIHSPEGLTVRMETTEWPLRATHTVCNEEICEDSCMEFFLTPNLKDERYVNIEINPFGVTHVGLGEGRHNRTHLDISDEGLVIETAITFGKGWSVTFHVPYTFLDRYFGSHGAEMRANLYKCGDLTVTPHYSTWNPVIVPAPDYHRPEFFGSLILA